MCLQLIVKTICCIFENYYMNRKKMNVAVLVNNSSLTAKSVRENINDFIPYGFTAEDADKLENMVSAYRALKPDTHYLTERKTLGSNLAKTQKTLLTSLTRFALKLELEKARGLEATTEFEIAKLQRANLPTVIKVIAEIIESAKANSDIKGFTLANAALLSEIELLFNQLTALVSDYNKANSQRENATIYRQQLVSNINTMYAAMCKTGKFIYKNSNSAEYKNYVMYSTASINWDNAVIHIAV